MTRTTIAILFVCVVASAREARAETCPRAGTPWLRVDADASLMPAIAQLRLELAPRGIDVCVAPPSATEAPLADVTIRSDGDFLSLSVEDRATDKRLVRSVSLRGIPADARAFAIAVAVDELVRASWLEAVMTHREAPHVPPTPPPPPIVIVVARESLAPRDVEPSTTNGALGAMLAGEHASGGQTWGGFDARASWGGRLTIGGRLGYRLGVVARADHGDVESSAILGGLSLAYALASRRSPWNLDVFARGDAARIAFVGRAASGARGASDAALGWFAGGGVAGSRAIGGTWRLVLELSATAPLRSVGALDNGREVIAMSGAMFGLALGVSAGL